MAGTGTKRITELTEASTIQSGDFIAVDSSARGTKKVSTDTLATSAALTAETNARAGADEQMSERMDGIEEQTALIQNPTKTVSGALVSFADGADMPMVACTAEIVPKQAGTGTPSPDNVRPISGWESVNLYKSGKNIVENIGTTTTVSGLTITKNSDGSFTANGTSTAVVAWTVNYNLEKILKSGQQYILSGCTGGNYSSTYALRVADANGSAKAISVNGDASFTADGTAKSLQLLVRSGQTLNNVTFYPMIRVAGTDATYEPYTGTTTTTSLGRTVYGGTLDVVSGVLTVNSTAIDMGSISWYEYGSTSSYTRYVSSGIDGNAKANGNGICSCFEFVGAGQSWKTPMITIGSGGSRLTVLTNKDAYASAAAFKTAMSGQTLVYELATPQTYQLTPTEVSTLLGDNNVWADSGDVEITYRRDISIVLENLENALSGSNSLNTMMMSAPTESTAEEPTEDEAEDDMR